MGKRRLLTQRKDGRWCCRKGGRTFYFGRDRAEAERRFLAWSKTLHEKPKHSEGFTTVGDLTGVLRLKVGEGVSEATVQQYAGAIRRLVEHFGKDRAVDTISRGEWLGHRDRLQAGVTKTTFKSRVLGLRAVLSAAAQREWIRPIPAGSLKTPPAAAIRRERAAKVRHYNVDEWRRLVEACEEDWLLVVLHLGVSCGFSVSDCTALRWHHIEKDGFRWWCRMPRGKTGSPRDNVIWHETYPVLQRVGLPLLMPNGLPPVRVFTSEQGAPHRRSNVGPAWKTLCKRAGVEDRGTYGLRHTCAVYGQEAADSEAVSATLGHEVSGMSSVYTGSVSRSRLANVSDTIRAILLGGEARYRSEEIEEAADLGRVLGVPLKPPAKHRHQ